MKDSAQTRKHEKEKVISKKVNGSKSISKIKALKVGIDPLNPQPLPPRIHPT
jgi:hypothetical protein